MSLRPLAERMAFPCNSHYGMSYREWLAAMCLQGILANQGLSYTHPHQKSGTFDINAEEAVKQADALIKALERK